MSSAQNSPYVAAGTIVTTCAPSIEEYGPPFYTPHVALPELPPYGVAYNNFYLPGGNQPNAVDEPFYDRQDCMTPLSQHSFIDLTHTPLEAPEQGLLHTNSLEVSAHPTSSPRSFMTPTWTPEPMNQFEEHCGPSTPAASPRLRHQYSDSNTSTTTVKPVTGRVFTPIAPYPSSAAQTPSLKRAASRECETPGAKRKRSASPSSALTTELNAEDELLLRLKDEEGLTWKEIQVRFSTDLNKTFQVPALQMRLKRLRERMREWTETDVQALRLAHEYWNDNKFEIISAKMMEYGANEKWSSKQCSKKWHELTMQQEYFTPHLPLPPMFTPIVFPTSFVHASSETYQPFITTSA